ncbi:MAG: hypothetical protein ACRDL7_05145 [Gaiellaceae bacterium]
MLTNIRVTLAKREDMKRIVKFVLVACMLHNLLVAEVDDDDDMEPVEEMVRNKNVIDAEGENLAATNDRRQTQLIVQLLGRIANADKAEVGGGR